MISLNPYISEAALGEECARCSKPFILGEPVKKIGNSRVMEAFHDKCFDDYLIENPPNR